MPAKILCVGNCGFDQSTLNSYLRARFDATILTADRASDADAVLARQDVDLVLVNRVFDRDGDSGIDWIRRRFDPSGAGARKTQRPATVGAPPRVMLISGYDDAQREAAKAGAVPGFGKNDLRTNLAADRIAAALDSRQGDDDRAASDSEPPQETP